MWVHVCVSACVRLTRGVPLAVPVQHVQRGDEELVCVLLLVAGQVFGVGPHQVQQPEGNVGRPVSGVELADTQHQTHRMTNRSAESRTQVIGRIFHNGLRCGLPST